MIGSIFAESVSDEHQKNISTQIKTNLLLKTTLIWNNWIGLFTKRQLKIESLAFNLIPIICSNSFVPMTKFGWNMFDAYEPSYLFCLLRWQYWHYWHQRISLVIKKKSNRKKVVSRGFHLEPLVWDHHSTYKTIDKCNWGSFNWLLLRQNFLLFPRKHLMETMPILHIFV